MIEDYINIKPEKVETISQYYAVSITPRPNQEDYQNGSITRFMCYKISNKEFIEINDKNSIKLKRNPLYKVFNFKWEISGPKYDVVTDGFVKVRGVFNINDETIDGLRRSYPDIRNKLDNPLEFWKP